MADSNQLSKEQRTKILDNLFKNEAIVRWMKGGSKDSNYTLNELFPSSPAQPAADSAITELKTGNQYADPQTFTKAVAGLIDRSSLRSWRSWGETEANLRQTLKTELKTLVDSGGEKSSVVARKPGTQSFAAADMGLSDAGGVGSQAAAAEKADQPATKSAGAARDRQAPFGPMGEDLGLYTPEERKQRVGVPYNMAQLEQLQKLPAYAAALDATALNGTGDKGFTNAARTALANKANTGEPIEPEIKALIASVKDEPTRKAIEKQYAEYTSQAGFKVDERTTIVKPTIGAHNGHLDELLNVKLAKENAGSKDTSKTVRDFIGGVQASGWLEAFGKDGKSELGARAAQGVPRAWADMTREQKVAHAAGLVESYSADAAAQKTPEAAQQATAVAENLKVARERATELALIYKIEQQAEAVKKGGVYAQAATTLGNELEAEKNPRARQLGDLYKNNPAAFAGVKDTLEKALIRNAQEAQGLEGAGSWVDTSVATKQDELMKAVRKEMKGEASGAPEKAAETQPPKPSTIAPPDYLPKDILSVKPDQIVAQKAKGGLSEKEYQDLGLVGKGTNRGGKKLTDDQRYLRNNLIALGVAKADEKGNLVGTKEGQGLKEAVDAYVAGSPLKDDGEITQDKLRAQTVEDMKALQGKLTEAGHDLGKKFGKDGRAGAYTVKAIEEEKKKENGLFTNKSVAEVARETAPAESAKAEEKKVEIQLFKGYENDSEKQVKIQRALQQYLVASGAVDVDASGKPLVDDKGNLKINGKLGDAVAALNIVPEPNGKPISIDDKDIAAHGKTLKEQRVDGITDANQNDPEVVLSALAKQKEAEKKAKG
jgi:hypothetical protein